jgi:hypothetical protein
MRSLSGRLTLAWPRSASEHRRCSAGPAAHQCGSEPAVPPLGHGLRRHSGPERRVRAWPRATRGSLSCPSAECSPGICPGIDRGPVRAAPTYSNGLKDIGRLLGVKWSAANASGIQSVAWRLAWETGRDETLKQQLLRYNLGDCFALRRITEFLLSASAGTAAQPDDGGPAVASVEDLETRGFRFGKTEFFCSELAHVNKCAYSDYQREKVYVRTSPALRTSLRRGSRSVRGALRSMKRSRARSHRRARNAVGIRSVARDSDERARWCLT